MPHRRQKTSGAWPVAASPPHGTQKTAPVRTRGHYRQHVHQPARQRAARCHKCRQNNELTGGFVVRRNEGPGGGSPGRGEDRNAPARFTNVCLADRATNILVELWSEPWLSQRSNGKTNSTRPPKAKSHEDVMSSCLVSVNNRVQNTKYRPRNLLQAIEAMKRRTFQTLRISAQTWRCCSGRLLDHTRLQTDWIP